MERGKNGIIHAMKPHAKSALALALAIVGGIAAGLRCDASVTVENSLQYTPRPAAYTVKAYTEGSDPFIPLWPLGGREVRRGTGMKAILRGICLNEIAIHQMRVLSQVDNRNLLK